MNPAMYNTAGSIIKEPHPTKQEAIRIKDIVPGLV